MRTSDEGVALDHPRMDDRKLLAAAELARRHEAWTAPSAPRIGRYRPQLFIRYLAPYREVLPKERARAISRTWVLGVVRQESRFITGAKSSARERLMQ